MSTTRELTIMTRSNGTLSYAEKESTRGNANKLKEIAKVSMSEAQIIIDDVGREADLGKIPHSKANEVTRVREVIEEVTKTISVDTVIRGATLEAIKEKLTIPKLKGPLLDINIRAGTLATSAKEVEVLLQIMYGPGRTEMI
jgi:hypothetical protein